jgi:hypothetical protein
MGQLLNQGFKNVCNNGNLGNTPNLTPAEIYNLITGNKHLPQYQLQPTLYAGTFVNSFALTASPSGSKIIFGGVGQMFDTTFLNNLPSKTIFKFKIFVNSSGAGPSNVTFDVFITKTIGGEINTFSETILMGASIVPLIEYEFILSKEDLSEITNIRTSFVTVAQRQLGINIELYNFTNN